MTKRKPGRTLPPEDGKVNPKYPNYIICKNGSIYSLYRGKFLRPVIGKHGYARYNLCGNRLTLAHRVIMETFIGASDLQVNHKDGNKQNNSLENLEYVTSSENHLHAIKCGLRTPRVGEGAGSSKYDEIKVLTIITMGNAGFTPWKISKFGYVPFGAARAVLNNSTWKYLAYLKNLEHPQS